MADLEKDCSEYRKEKGMKLPIAIAVALTASTASAERINAYIEDVYRTVYEDVPYTTQECVNVQVHNNQGSAGADALAGMIIGGLLGKGLTGNDDGAAIGAILGGIAGAEDNAKRNRNTQPTTQRKCTNVTRYTREERTVYSHTTITFKVDGQTYTSTFVK